VSDLTPDAEPAPVPPPVDALLKLINSYGRHALETGEGIDDAGASAGITWRQIKTAVPALYAAGVAEGRRQATEERTEKLAKVEQYLTSPEVNRG